MLTPLPAKQWDIQKAAHLLNRAGFGGTPDEIKAFCELGFDRAVESVLDGPDDSTQFPKPAWAQPDVTPEAMASRRAMIDRHGRTFARTMATCVDRSSGGPLCIPDTNLPSHRIRQ